MPGEVADRLTRDERMAIYKWAGEGFSVKEICRLTNSGRPGGARLRASTVERVLGMPEAHKFVAKFQTEFLKTVKDVPVAEKKVRLNDIEKIRQRLMHVIDNSRIDRSKEELHKFLVCSRRMVELIDLARNEVEKVPGMTIGIGIGGRGDIGELTDEQLRVQREELLRKARIIVEQRTSEIDGDTEGDEGADKAGSDQVFLAPSEELRREELQERSDTISDLRRKEDGDKGVSAV